MAGYIVRRLALGLVTFFIATSLAFYILNVLPGDLAQRALGDYATPERIAALRDELGLDRNIVLRYFDWLWDLVRFDLGNSYYGNRTVIDQLQTRLPVTLELAGLAMFFSILLGIPSGIISALRPNSLADFIVRPLSIIGLALPNFWIGLLVLLLPSYWWNYAPPQYQSFWDDPLTNLQLMIPVSLILGIAVAAATSRLMRGTMLEVIKEDYVRTARAKGLREGNVVIRHALRNALLPVITLISLQFAALLGGAIILENIFAIPGMGTMVNRAIYERDYAIVQGVVVVSVLIYVGVNLIVDVAAPLIDPRIKLK